MSPRQLEFVTDWGWYRFSDDQYVVLSPPILDEFWIGALITKQIDGKIDVFYQTVSL